LLVVCGGCGGGPRTVPDVASADGIVAYSRGLTQADLTVAGTGGLTGTVRDDAGKPRANARVTLATTTAPPAGTADADEPETVVATARTGATGRYGFANVPPGRWRVRCYNPDRTSVAQIARVAAERITQATFGGDRALARIVVRPEQATLDVGQTRQYTCLGYNAAGHLLTGFAVTWQVPNTTVARVTAAGLVTARNPGSTTVDAVGDGCTGHAQLTVEGGGDLTNLFFLHHSTGQGIIVEGDVRGHIANHNSAHGTAFEFWDHDYNGTGLTDPQGVQTGISYNIPDDNTDPDGLHRLWTGTDAVAVECRRRILDNHQVIAFKSCFPASAIGDTARLNQYKTWYREIRDFLDTRPDRVFVVMSTPPLHRRATNSTEARNARLFANWLKSGEYLTGHPNVVCFDLFSLLAAPDNGSATANMLRYEYEQSHSSDDSHPNQLANQTVGPLFAQALIDAAEAGQ
jgi:hypothetical protein